jgi:xanthine dehydrogenase accessory factor
MDDPDEVLAEALDWARHGQAVALATVVATSGSSPRPVGARLAIASSGRFAGSVSSGCVEGEILATAEEVIASGRPILREFGASPEGIWSVALTCGGAIRIFVERLAQADELQALLDQAHAGRDSATLLALEDGWRRPLDSTIAGWDEPDRRAALAAARAGKCILIETRGGAHFLEFWRPPPRLLIVGAVHIAQSLAPMARLAGYDVTVIDPRAAFADPERFPGTRLKRAWPEEALAESPPDARTALVALSHEARIDDPALRAALASPAFYVGALGSCASAEKRRVRLRAQGVTESALARLHGPVGLAIGAATPAEIAIAIAAEMTEALRLASPVLPEAAAE